MTVRKHLRTGKLIRGYFIVGVAVSVFALGLVVSAPSEAGSAIILGLSITRLALAGGLAAIGAGFALGLRFLSTESRLEKEIVSKIQLSWVYSATVTVAVAATVLSASLILLTFKFTDAFVLARLSRLMPAFAWALVIGVATLVVGPRLKFKRLFELGGINLKVTVFAGAVLLLIVLFVVLTGLGLTPDRIGWDTPGVPLIGTQVLFVLMLALVLYGALRVIRSHFGLNLRQVDLIIAVLLWLGALVVWLSLPISPTFYSPTPRPPNFEYYPHSDAATVDIASQRLLVGEGLTEVAEKPLYSFFLAILHAIAGQEYANVIAAQTAVLALLPVVLYLVAARMHHPWSGLLLGILVIAREANAVALSGTINVSHSKLLMTDLPTTLGIAAFTLLLLVWLKKSNREKLQWPLLVGGFLGVLALLRSQVVVFLPALIILSAWQIKKNTRGKILHGSLVLLGFVLLTLPWVVRNFQYTGQFGYSQPLQARYIASQYSLTPELSAVAESTGFGSAVQFTLAYPIEVTRFVTAHFLHNEVSSLLALPTRFDLFDKLVTYYNLLPYWQDNPTRLWSECCSLNTYIEQTPFWDQWDGVIPADVIFPILFNLLIVAIGIGVAWRKVGVLTLVPIGVHVLYSLSTAIARVSGWRLILPVDWVVLLFYCIGVGQVILWLWAYFFRASIDVSKAEVKREQPKSDSRRLISVGLLMLAAGLIIPISELVLPRRYSSVPEVASETLEHAGLLASQGIDLDTFLSQPGADVRVGRALYPRFYPAGEGEPGGDSAFHVQPFPRMTFWVVGPDVDRVALPVAESPTYFPNATDVYVLGCVEDTFVRAAAVIFPASEAVLVSDDNSSFICNP